MDRLDRRGLLAALGAAALPQPAPAQPLGRPVRLLVGLAPGGSVDSVARVFAERMRGGFAPQFLVENRSGAGGRLAVEAVKAAAPDGATVLLTPASMMTLYPHIYPRSTRYDALVDFVPVSPICISAYAFAVAAEHPARTLAEFAAWARTQPDKVAFASPAAGSRLHLMGIRMAQLLGIGLTHVPYRGSAPALQDLVAGVLPAVLITLGEATRAADGGLVRILAHSGAARLPRRPEPPSFAELGLESVCAALNRKSASATRR